MIARLRAHPGGEDIEVFQADLTNFELPGRDYSVAVCAVSTLFMLPGRDKQLSCLTSAARHLRPGGRLFIEAFVPDPRRFDTAGQRTEERPGIDGEAHIVHSVHDPHHQLIRISHVLYDPDGKSAYDVELHYVTPAQLDEMAADAGLLLESRWHDWDGAPATSASTDPVSVYVA